jgi:hypothetical protein
VTLTIRAIAALLSALLLSGTDYLRSIPALAGESALE